ncbi:ferrous iron transport protein A [Marinicella sp. S1101]|uniref:ferrous iron transport protein A n=1 Tax=Marinicella marina TaxID=2996016 RepID=UPI0022608F29|nr:ferrous iron transport protein A [Marinicella marina]MCX7552571.1 ferrous iron transport protein A [Marinicella marina]MDJ1139447.1 ferrous iron transport protein A [Marinicella marina]
MTATPEISLQLSQAKTGKTYQICDNTCSDTLRQKLALMGLGLGMVIELVALYKHGAVIKTSFGHIAMGADLINTISVSIN